MFADREALGVMSSAALRGAGCRRLHLFHIIKHHFHSGRSAVIMSPDTSGVICFAQAPVVTTLYGMSVAVATPRPLALGRDDVCSCGFCVSFFFSLAITRTHRHSHTAFPSFSLSLSHLAVTHRVNCFTSHVHPPIHSLCLSRALSLSPSLSHTGIYTHTHSQ